MDKPEKPDEEASAAEIQEYLDSYEAWCEIQGAKKVKEMSMTEGEPED